MNQDLKMQILENRFIERLRLETVIDRDAYESLCRALKNLAEEWRGVSHVDKEVVQRLYVLYRVAMGVAEKLAPHQPEMAREIEKMAIEVDALVLHCLAT